MERAEHPRLRSEGWTARTDLGTRHEAGLSRNHHRHIHANSNVHQDVVDEEEGIFGYREERGRASAIRTCQFRKSSPDVQEIRALAFSTYSRRVTRCFPARRPSPGRSYIGFNPLLDPRLMWHDILGTGGTRELLWLERTEGYINKFLSISHSRGRLSGGGEPQRAQRHSGRGGHPRPPCFSHGFVCGLRGCICRTRCVSRHADLKIGHKGKGESAKTHHEIDDQRGRIHARVTIVRRRYRNSVRTSQHPFTTTPIDSWSRALLMAGPTLHLAALNILEETDWEEVRRNGMSTRLAPLWWPDLAPPPALFGRVRRVEW